MNNKILADIFAIGTVSILLVSCGSKQSLTAAQQVYAGKWVAADGTYVQIFSDGSGSAKGANTSVEGGSATIADQTLKISLGPIEQKFQISEFPKESDGKWIMKLNGIAYTKEGGGATGNFSQGEDSSEKSEESSAKKTSSKKDADKKSNVKKDSAEEDSSEKSAGFSSQEKSGAIGELTANIKEKFTEQTGITVKNVDCPSNAVMNAKEGAKCEITDDGNRKLTVTVNENKETGTIGWKAGNGLLSLKEIEKSIRGKLGESVKANCRGKFKIAHTGDKFTCDVKDTVSKQKGVAEVTVKTEDGQIAWEMK